MLRKINEENLQNNLKAYKRAIKEGNSTFIGELKKVFPNLFSPWSDKKDECGLLDKEDVSMPREEFNMESYHCKRSVVYKTENPYDTGMFYSASPMMANQRFQWERQYVRGKKMTCALQLLFDSRNFPLIEELAERGILKNEDIICDCEIPQKGNLNLRVESEKDFLSLLILTEKTGLFLVKDVLNDQETNFIKKFREGTYDASNFSSEELKLFEKFKELVNSFYEMKALSDQKVSFIARRRYLRGSLSSLRERMSMRNRNMEKERPVKEDEEFKRLIEQEKYFLNDLEHLKEREIDVEEKLKLEELKMEKILEEMREDKELKIKSEEEKKPKTQFKKYNKK